MPTATHYEHVILNEHGSPVLEPSGFKINFLVRDHVQRGLDAQQLLELYPHLTLGQIHSALAYYWDHQASMDAALETDRLETERLLDQVAKPLDRADLERRLAQKSSGR
jgi:uncharacterized protein (DUF433 family)